MTTYLLETNRLAKKKLSRKRHGLAKRLTTVNQSFQGTNSWQGKYTTSAYGAVGHSPIHANRFALRALCSCTLSEQEKIIKCIHKARRRVCCNKRKCKKITTSFLNKLCKQQRLSEAQLADKHEKHVCTSNSTLAAQPKNSKVETLCHLVWLNLKATLPNRQWF